MRATIDNDKTSAWAVDPQFGKNHAARFELETPIGFEGGTVLTFTLEFNNNTGHGIGRPRLSLGTQTGASSRGQPVPEAVRAALARLDAEPKRSRPSRSSQALWPGIDCAIRSGAAEPQGRGASPHRTA